MHLLSHNFITCINFCGYNFARNKADKADERREQNLMESEHFVITENRGIIEQQIFIPVKRSDRWTLVG